MADATHTTDRKTGRETLTWEVGRPLTFYTVASADGAAGTPFVRDFHNANQQMLLFARQHGGTWQVHEWEWNPLTDETTYVRPAGRPLNGNSGVRRMASTTR